MSETEPPEGSDFTADTGDYIFAMNVWMAAPYDAFKEVGFDGTFQEDFQFSRKFVDAGANLVLTTNVACVPDTVTVSDWYVVMKAGISLLYILYSVVNERDMIYLLTIVNYLTK